MPLKNEFIATDFSLVPIDKNVRKLFFNYSYNKCNYMFLYYFIGTQ